MEEYLTKKLRMNGKGKAMIDSSNSMRIFNYVNQIENKDMLRCYHDIAVTHQRYTRTPNKGTEFNGFPLWKDDEQKICLNEGRSYLKRNKCLEQKVKDLVIELETMNFKVTNLKGVKEERSSRGDSEAYLSNEVRHLKEENTTLRGKVAKEKLKRAKAEDELKALKEEI